MAIKTNTRELVTVILQQDGAVITDDKGDDNYRAYIDSGFDAELLKLDGKATTWKLQRLTYDQRKRVHDLAGVERHEFVVRCALLSVVGFEHVGDNGVVTEMGAVRHEPNQQFNRPLVSMAWMTEALLPFPVLLELSSMAMLLSEGSIPFSAK